MQIYLMQHGEAAPKTLDPTRSLTAQGRQHVEQVAMLAKRLGLEVAQIRHSGKARAEQTAAIMGRALAPPGGVVAVSGLAPKDNVQPAAKALALESQPVLLVGHLPFLERLAGLLLTGDPDRSVVKFCNAGIVCLVWREEQWRVTHILTPDIAGP